MRLLIHNVSDWKLEYGSEDASGLDLRCHATSYFLLPNETRKFDTGITVEIPTGYTGFVMPRSGLTSKNVICRIGVVDPDFRGRIAATLKNEGNEPYEIKRGDKIAQLVVCACPRLVVTEVEADVLSSTARGDKGWGSTGR